MVFGFSNRLVVFKSVVICFWLRCRPTFLVSCSRNMRRFSCSFLWRKEVVKSNLIYFNWNTIIHIFTDTCGKNLTSLVWRKLNLCAIKVVCHKSLLPGANLLYIQKTWSSLLHDPLCCSQFLLHFVYCCQINCFVLHRK